MKKSKSHFTKLFTAIFVIVLLIACGNNKQSDNDENDTLSSHEKTIEDATNTINDDTPILEYLRALPEDEYGGTDHIKDADFKTNDNAKRYVEYKSEKEGRYYLLQFKQLSSTPRKLFIRLSYDKYLMGPDDGYNAFNGCELIEKKDGRWLNVSNELPENWKKDYYTAKYDIASDELKLYQIDFDTKTGKEIDKKLIETAKWQNNELVIINSDAPTKSKVYKIIVACSATKEVSEDFNWFMEDIRVAFKKFGVYVKYIDLSKDKTIKIDDEKLSLELDLTEIIKENNIENNAYIFLENGKEPQIAEYDQSDMTILEAQKYFGFDK